MIFVMFLWSGCGSSFVFVHSEIKLAEQIQENLPVLVGRSSLFAGRYNRSNILAIKGMTILRVECM